MPYPLIYNGQDTATLRHEEMAGRIKDPPYQWQLWRFRLNVADIVTPAAATSQEIDLTDVTDISTARAFPTNVWIKETHIQNVTDFAGGSVSACTAELGDTDDPNGLVTASSVFTGVGQVFIRTTGAAQYALRPEPAFVPTITLRTTGGNVSALTAGILDGYVPYLKFHPAAY